PAAARAKCIAGHAPLLQGAANPSGSQLSLGLRKGPFFELNPFPYNPFDPLIDTSFPMQLGQESGTSG
ncbi:MAG TPA: hypothetical protein VKJ01_23580, partial [Candidatus Solibacter sp.]|nr:hypothetical protein [Candidatus Solibacter sp.]